MASSRACSFCALPDGVRVDAIARWQNGERGSALSRWLVERGFDITPRQVEYCLKQAKHDGPSPDQAAKAAKVAEALEKVGVDLAELGDVKTVRYSKWQNLTKNAEGEAEIHDLQGVAIVLDPSWATGPKWPVIQPAKPCIVKPPVQKAAARKGRWRTAVIFPDLQCGFRRDIDTMKLDPFHDEAAMGAALRIAKAADPDVVVHLGDFLDFAQFGRFDQEAGFALTVQPALDRAHRFLVETQAAAPRAKQVLLEGNHDRRLQTSIVKNSLAAFGIRRAEAPDEWPVLSVPNLLRLDDLGVEYIGGYPAGEFWVNDNLVCIHGLKALGGKRSTAAAVIEDERVSTIQGHVHRVEMKDKTRRVRGGHRQAFAATLGCLCRIDGAVPSTRGSTDHRGSAVRAVEDWQHAVGVVTYEEGDGMFNLEVVRIHDGVACFRGEWIAA